jgi:hypothetical protein
MTSGTSCCLCRNSYSMSPPHGCYNYACYRAHDKANSHVYCTVHCYFLYGTFHFLGYGDLKHTSLHGDRCVSVLYILQTGALKLIYAKGSRRLGWCLFRIRMAILVLRLRPLGSMAHNSEVDKNDIIFRSKLQAATSTKVSYSSGNFTWDSCAFMILWYEGCLIYPQIEASSTKLAIIPAGTPLLRS